MPACNEFLKPALLHLHPEPTPAKLRSYQFRSISPMKTLIVATGASGAGKTATLKALEAEHLRGVVFCYFDAIGIPSPEDMKRKYGSGEEWQKQTTIDWVQRIKRDYSDDKVVVLDGQVRQSFVDHACQRHGVANYRITLFDCDNSVRNERLDRQRGQPELINEQMQNWARYLRKQAIERREAIIDTTDLTIPAAVSLMREIVLECL